ncbi:MAG: peptide deformylase [Gammaproteobacteria bacterium]|nr:peptide deformylase [Gammaproteobacteria bacterium]
MALLTVLHYPDKKLRNIAAPVSEFNDDLHTIVKDMFETMYAEKGVGLASIQVGIQQRIVVIDISEEKNAPLCLINPEIVYEEGFQYEEEGCLSVPEFWDRVERVEKIKVRAFDQKGKPLELEAEGLLSICIQHEIDHLNGILFVDHMSRLKQERFNKKILKLQKAEVKA